MSPRSVVTSVQSSVMVSPQPSTRQVLLWVPSPPDTNATSKLCSCAGSSVTTGAGGAVTTGAGVAVTSGSGVAVTSGSGVAVASGSGVAVTTGSGLTVGSGMGVAVGSAVGAAVGMVGVFCGVTNAPVAALMLSVELFGREYLPLFGVTAAVSFMLSGHFSLYHAQRFAQPKLGSEEKPPEE